MDYVVLTYSPLVGLITLYEKEKLNNDIDISDVADIFDINKIEVE